MWASGCEYCLATDSLVVSVITGGCTGGSSSLPIDKILCFKAQTRFIKTSSVIKYGVKRHFGIFIRSRMKVLDLCSKIKVVQS